jgi:hypothetical protein
MVEAYTRCREGRSAGCNFSSSWNFGFEAMTEKSTVCFRYFGTGAGGGGWGSSTTGGGTFCKDVFGALPPSGWVDLCSLKQTSEQLNRQCQ